MSQLGNGVPSKRPLTTFEQTVFATLETFQEALQTLHSMSDNLHERIKEVERQIAELTKAL